MFSLAYVILPFADIAPADAIRTSLAAFQRGGRGEVPDSWLTFRDETEGLRRTHEARFTFIDNDKGGLQIGGDHEACWHLDTARVRDEMRRRGLQRWSVRFADATDLDAFFGLFGRRLERHPATGGYGRWLNPLGRWDWWDLGGRFDGYIIGDPSRGVGRSVGQVSSGENQGRSVLANIEDQIGAALGHAPSAAVDVRSDRNVELAATLLTDAQAGRGQAYPGTLVLPPGAVADHSRWLGTWPELGPASALAWLGLAPDASWPEAVEASYARFGDHWVAGVAYHC